MFFYFSAFKLDCCGGYSFNGLVSAERKQTAIYPRHSCSSVHSQNWIFLLSKYVLFLFKFSFTYLFFGFETVPFTSLVEMAELNLVLSFLDLCIRSFYFITLIYFIKLFVCLFV